MPKYLRNVFAFLLILGIYQGSNRLFAQESLINVQLDNDIFNLLNQTDRYYTNGLHIGVFLPVFQKSPVNYLLPGGKIFNEQASGLSLYQGIYTPIDIYTDALQDTDRPYAAVLLVSQERIALSTTYKFKITSSFGLGLMGKHAGGEFVQNFIHSLTPYSEHANGWQHQLGHDFLVDYRINAQKGWTESRWIQVTTSGYGQVGTFRNLIGARARLSLGYFDNQFINPFAIDLSNSFSIRAFGGIEAYYLFYDATLEGGVFRSAYQYVIPGAEVNRQRISYEFGIEARYKKFTIEAGRLSQNAEFINAKDHGWGYIKLGFFF